MGNRGQHPRHDAGDKTRHAKETPMKLPKNAKIESVCADEKSNRPAIAHPYLEIKDGAARVIATNGRAMVAIPVEVEEGEESGWVSIPALAAARKASSRDGVASVHCNGTCATTTADFPRPFKNDATMTFPNYRQVIPEGEQKGVFKLAFNVELLAAVVKAAGGTGIVSVHQPADDPTATMTLSIQGAKDGTVAVMMPCRAS